MLKARNRKLSMILVLAMLMTMFAGIGTASAAATYTTLTAPTISTHDTDTQTLGKVKVEVPDTRVLPSIGGVGDIATQEYWEYLTVSLPSGLEFSSDSIPYTVTTDIIVVGAKTSATTWDLKIAKITASTEYDNSFLLEFNNILVKSGSGNIDASFASPGTAFPMGTATIAKLGDGGTMTMAKSVKTIGDAGGSLDSIIIVETQPGVIKAGDVIELRLPSGFSWGSTAAVYVKGGWGFTNQNNATAAVPGDTDAFALDVDSDKRILKVEVLPAFTASTAATTAGRIVIGSDPDANYAKIKVDDTAKFGDIEVAVSSDTNSDVTEQDVLVATYGDYGVKVEEGTKTAVIAGHNEQKVGKFTIVESIPNSLVEGRTVILELPSGVKFVPGKFPTVSAVSGPKLFSNFEEVTGSKMRAIKATVGTPDRSKAAKLELKDAQIYVQPGFEGPIELTISGSAGAEGTVVIADCVPAVTLSAADLPNVIIGEMNQKAADIVITEGEKGSILYEANHKKIVVELDGGVYFAKKPTVTVNDGNLEIDSYKTILGGNALEITLKYASTKVSKLTISDILLTLNRTVPEGPVKATLAYSEGDVVSDGAGSTALDEGYFKDSTKTDKSWSRTSAGDVTIATTITPAQGGGTTSFTINSNIYTVNGLAKVMDVAPYIKGDRTYVPMRYLGEALGADVVWDDAARTVTLTKGDTTVVFTIGSTSYTVNGEAKVADVAPEIANDRTMLPARFVAEAFGATVGWDGNSGTVLIQQ